MSATLETARAVDRDYREASLRLGRATLSLLPESPRILTHCWADAYLFGLVAAAREAGREIECALDPAQENYDEVKTPSRQQFLSEHKHDDDEDRYFAKGAGVFYLHANEKVHAVYCEAGDLISVPANTTHWFDMGTAPHYVSVRFFHDDDGWVGHFTGSPIAESLATFDQLAERRAQLA